MKSNQSHLTVFQSQIRCSWEALQTETQFKRHAAQPVQRFAFWRFMAMPIWSIRTARLSYLLQKSTDQTTDSSRFALGFAVFR